MVEFSDKKNNLFSGELLTYERFGEACIRLGNEKVWVPFSRLTNLSKEKITKAAVSAADPKKYGVTGSMGLVITMMVLLVYLVATS